MAVTATRAQSMKEVVNQGDPAKVVSSLQKAKFGDMMELVDETITIPSGTTLNLLTASAAKRKALTLQSVRVVTGTATGLRQIGDAGATPSATVVAYNPATGILTFEAAITVARVVWVPAADVDPDTLLAPAP